ncbi:MAG TPA: 2-hydroxyglutaryl-CoA dehydratase, partial [Planctomycetes bacterium]|nr:2-hydroxyglutaryl-CoA dehydratase [Planctomycetota bacterium]
MITAGVDGGSRAVKAVVVADGRIIGRAVRDSGPQPALVA